MHSSLDEYRTRENRKTGRDVGREVDLEEARDLLSKLIGHPDRIGSDPLVTVYFHGKQNVVLQSTSLSAYF